MKNGLLAVGPLLSAIAILAGAFGAHGLKSRLDPAGLELWETAARYLMYAGLGITLVGLAGLNASQRGFQVAGWTLFVGAAIGSGTVAAGGRVTVGDAGSGRQATAGRVGVANPGTGQSGASCTGITACGRSSHWTNAMIGASCRHLCWRWAPERLGRHSIPYPFPLQEREAGDFVCAELHKLKF